MLRCRQGSRLLLSQGLSCYHSRLTPTGLSGMAHGYFFSSLRFENVCLLSFYMNNLAEYNMLESHFPSLQILFHCLLTVLFWKKCETSLIFLHYFFLSGCLNNSFFILEVNKWYSFTKPKLKN